MLSVLRSLFKPAFDLCLVYLDEPIFWRIRQGDPARFPLAALEDWGILNPLVQAHVLRRENKNTSVQLDAVVGEEVFLRAWALVLVAERPQRPSSEYPKSSWRSAGSEPREPLEREGLDRLLEALRLASKQARFPRDRGSRLCFGLRSLPIPLFPSVEPWTAVSLSHYSFRAALRVTDLEEVDSLLRTSDPPNYRKLLLDGLCAHLEKDYHSSLLNTALAIESMARFCLARQAKARGGSDAEDLIEDAHRSKKFMYLFDGLFEKCFGVENSLKNTDQALFNEITQKFWPTRNALVHFGGPRPGDNLEYEVGPAGSLRGLRLALELCRWFKLDDAYPIEHESIRGAAPRQI